MAGAGTAQLVHKNECEQVPLYSGFMHMGMGSRSSHSLRMRQVVRGQTHYSREKTAEPGLSEMESPREGRDNGRCNESIDRWRRQIPRKKNRNFWIGLPSAPGAGNIEGPNNRADLLS